MKSASKVLLGYEVPSGDPVEIPLNGHIAITGQTQNAGKTTTLDALITRSGRRAVTFITKRGESAFDGARRIKAYFRERTDWQFVESIIEAAMRQKMRFERAWIMRAVKGAKTLADVSRNLEKLMETARGMNADMYMQLHAYLEIVLPQIERLEYSHSVEIGPGLNVMDLSSYSAEMQALVIRSVLEWVHEKEHDVIVVIPEAWETLPEGRGSPVKLACEQIFRKGAGIGNLIWLDSQDIAGVWKEALRACSVWIMGVQSEIHEVKRMLAHLPTPNSLKPKPEQVMCLTRGQFYVRFGRELKLVYVQPTWMDRAVAIEIAAGHLSVIPSPREALKSGIESYATRKVSEEDRYTAKDLPVRIYDPKPVKRSDFPHSRFTEEDVDEQKEREYQNTIKRLEVRIEDLQRQLRGQEPAPEPKEGGEIKIPVIELNVDKPEIEVTIRRFTIKMSDEDTPGQLARLIWEGYFDGGRRLQDIYTEFRDRGWMAQLGAPNRNIGPQLQRLVELGFIRRLGEAKQPLFQIRDGGVKVRVKEVEVAA